MIRIQKCTGDDEIEQEQDINLWFERMCTEISAKQQETKQRTDKYNVEIKAKTKNHKISFRDEINPEAGLADIYEVVNWKTFNVKERDPVDDCLCQIS
ncbi:unnamed protein product (macronuclear) [Paramecium tetraurelia]|uniref:Uncharacterized protein n=1 Tax=Paramecium tetraurelia TaxID=5888 RepID=A0CYS5_PARTE|nr:uncharacterized protein GSPATT00011543001 [Paramecium tetraurelia]CAK75942.1 unnamed protein product [Paramecium tetraurelia]|eukprot:XP_001443339.1 hypothetical protein (macronuclear) [Paramecium tetraurelia strain d4-2]